MNSKLRKKIKLILALALTLVATCYYFSAMRANFVKFNFEEGNISIGYILVSIIIFVIAYLSDSYIWNFLLKQCKNNSCIPFSKIVTIMSISDIYRCLPGKVWGVVSQCKMLKKHDVSSRDVVGINFLSLLVSLLTSFYLLILYFGFCVASFDKSLTVFLFLVTIVLNLIFVFCGLGSIKKFLSFFQRITTIEVHITQFSWRVLLWAQTVSIVGAVLSGVSGYYLIIGVGLPISFGDVFVLLSSINLSWVIGQISVLPVRGLGVREGTMLFLLDNFVPAETALFFPILFRVMISIVDLFFLIYSVTCIAIERGRLSFLYENS